MKSRAHYTNSLALLVGVALFAPSHAALGQSKDPLVGTWLLDRGKSDFTPDNDTLQQRTMIFKAIDKGVQCSIKTESTRGDTSESGFTAHYDGKDVPIDVSVLDTVSLHRIDANTVERTGKIHGKVVETATMKISPDGKVLTISTKGSVDGQDYQSTQIFDRQ